MRTKSVEVLDESDRMERILDWALFKQEQDAQLWSNTGVFGPRNWEPGDPIHKKPPPSSFAHLFGRQHVRPMAQLMDELLFHVDQENFDDIAALGTQCLNCEVAWMGPEPKCWVCGDPKIQPIKETKSLKQLVGMDFDGLTLVEARASQGAHDGPIIMDFRYIFNTEQFASYMRGVSEGLAEFNRGLLAGVRRQMAHYVSAINMGILYGEGRAIPWSHHIHQMPVSSPTNPFKITPIEKDVRFPGIADLNISHTHWTTRIEFPENYVTEHAIPLPENWTLHDTPHPALANANRANFPTYPVDRPEQTRRRRNL